MIGLPAGLGLLKPMDDLWNLYAWGNRTAGVQGDGLTSPNLRSPTAKSLTLDLLMIVTGSYSGYITKSGELFVAGLNTNGQLGIGDTSAHNSWTQVAGTWKYISFADVFGYAIDSNGKLYHAGTKQGYRDGAGGTSGNNTSWTQIGTDTDWVSVSAGGSNSGGWGVAIKDTGAIYAWGQNAVTGGSCGVGQGTSNVSTPTRMIFSDNSNASAKSVGCTTSATIIIGTDDKLYTTGGATYNGLFSAKTKLTALDASNTYSKIAGGVGTNSFFAKRIAGDWIAGGHNANGQLGNGSTTNVNTFESFNGASTDWDWITLSNCASLFAAIGRKNNGTLFGWGSYATNGLGNSSGNTTSPTQIGSDTDWRGLSSFAGVSVFAWK